MEIRSDCRGDQQALRRRRRAAGLQARQAAWLLVGPRAAGKDVLAYISADLPDTEETREWVKSYTRTKLITRFQQDAIYLRWLSVETELVRPLERVTRNEEE